MARYRVLAVDNQPASVRDYWEALREADMEVTECLTKEQAIRKYNEEPFDIIILDLMMNPHNAESSGLEVVSFVRESSGVQSLPIILFTINKDSIDAKELVLRDSLMKIVYKADTSRRQLAEITAEFIKSAKSHESGGVKRSKPTPESKYFVRDSSDEAVEVIFVSSATQDAVRLYSSWRKYDNVEWKKSVFFDLFHERLELQCPFTLSVRFADSSDNGIQGMVFAPGEIEYAIFESAPWNRYTPDGDRLFKWVGKVLVAWLIREHLAQGSTGRIVICEKDLETQKFLKRIGFEQYGERNVYYINFTKATAIVSSVT